MLEQNKIMHLYVLVSYIKKGHIHIFRQIILSHPLQKKHV
jgi:hypothetical protein